MELFSAYCLNAVKRNDIDRKKKEEIKDRMRWGLNPREK